MLEEPTALSGQMDKETWARGTSFGVWIWNDLQVIFRSFGFDVPTS